LRSFHVAEASAGWLERGAGRTTPATAFGRSIPSPTEEGSIWPLL